MRERVHGAGERYDIRKTVGHAVRAGGRNQNFRHAQRALQTPCS